VARGVNATSRKFLKRSASANNTEVRVFAARQNGTEPHLTTRGNSTASLIARNNSAEPQLIARGNGTTGGLGTRSNIVNSRLAARSNNTVVGLFARSNSTEVRALKARSSSTESHISARGLNISDRAVLFLRDALNSTRVHDSSVVFRKSLNSTSLQPSN
jgi:hypothetical protein